MSDNKWTPELELYTNLWEGYDRRIFFNSMEAAENDKETAENIGGFIGTFKLVTPEYIETIINQREELAEQVKELNKLIRYLDDKLNHNL